MTKDSARKTHYSCFCPVKGQIALITPLYVIICFGFLLLLSPAQSLSQSAASETSEKMQSGKQARQDSTDDDNFIKRAADTFLNHHPARVLGHPATFSVLPIVYYDFRTGVNFGVRGVVQSRLKRPYLYKLEVQALASHKGSHKHALFLDYPQIGAAGFGLQVRAEWTRDLEARYYGLGNDSQRDSELVNQGNERFIDEDYYIYNLKRPRFTVKVVRRLFRRLLLGVGAGFEWVEPQLKTGPARSYLGQDRPFGLHGGSTRSVHLSLSIDSRSSDVFPAHGFLTEFNLETAFATVEDTSVAASTVLLERQVSYQRLTFSHAHFLPLRSQRLIFANRIAVETVIGDAPYYALGDLADMRRTHVIGGSESLRGYKSRRFQDKAKLLTLTELRYNLHQVSVLSHQFDIILITFFDTGRVADRLGDLAPGGLHMTFGFGGWLNWNNSTIIRLDVGRSPEGWAPYVRFEAAF